MTALRQRQPRIQNEKHLRFIRQLPCCICGARDVHAAHLRMSSAKHGKFNPGVGAKPDDFWVTPLCAGHHVDFPDAQHAIGEPAFWEIHQIDPFKLALSLWEVSGDLEAAQSIISEVT